jgi:tetratricopeptide (TPR) repeat protein
MDSDATTLIGRPPCRHVVALIACVIMLLSPNSFCSADDVDQLSRARANIARELYGEAVVACDEALKKDPNRSEAYIIRAAANNKRRDYQQAIKDADACLKIDGTQARALVQRAIANLALFKHDEAIEDCKKAIAIDPSLQNAYYQLGLAYQSAEKFEESLPPLTKAIQLKPSDRRAYFARAWSEHQLEKDGKAVEDYDRAIRYYPPSDSDDMFLLPNQKFKAAAWVSPDLLRAVTIYDTAPRKGEDNSELLRSRGMAYLQMGKVSSAIRDFRTANGAKKAPQLNEFPGFGSEKDWKKAFAVFKEGNSELTSGDTKDAIVAFQKALKIYPQFPACLHSMAVASMNAGAGWQAEICCIQAIAYRPEDWQLWHTLGTILYYEYKNQMGDPTKRETASAVLKNALALKPAKQEDRAAIESALHEVNSSELWQRVPEVGNALINAVPDPDY